MHWETKKCHLTCFIAINVQYICGMARAFKIVSLFLVFCSFTLVWVYFYFSFLRSHVKTHFFVLEISQSSHLEFFLFSPLEFLLYGLNFFGPLDFFLKDPYSLIFLCFYVSVLHFTIFPQTCCPVFQYPLPTISLWWICPLNFYFMLSWYFISLVICLLFLDNIFFMFPSPSSISWII